MTKCEICYNAGGFCYRKLESRRMKDLLGFPKHHAGQGGKEEPDSLVDCFGDTQMLNDNFFCLLKSESHMFSLKLLGFKLSRINSGDELSKIGIQSVK